MTPKARNNGDNKHNRPTRTVPSGVVTAGPTTSVDNSTPVDPNTSIGQPVAAAKEKGSVNPTSENENNTDQPTITDSDQETVIDHPTPAAAVLVGETVPVQAKTAGTSHRTKNKRKKSADKKARKGTSSVNKRHQSAASNVNLSSITSSMTCPACNNAFSGIIHQCNNGHSICATCSLTNKRCPTCQSSISSKIRNYAMEQLMSSLNIGCAHCKRSGTIKFITKHQRDCDARPWSCIDKSCTQTFDTVSELTAHLALSHSINVQKKQFGKSFECTFDRKVVMCPNGLKTVFDVGNGQAVLLHLKSRSLLTGGIDICDIRCWTICNDPNGRIASKITMNVQNYLLRHDCKQLQSLRSYHSKHNVDLANTLLVPAFMFTQNSALKFDVRFDKCSAQRDK